MYEERMRPGHWLGPALCVPFSALSLMAGWQQGHPVCKPLMPRAGGGGGPEGDPDDPV